MLIKSKIVPPVTYQTLVERPRLFKLLDRLGGGQILLCVAATGYAKTTLVSQWQASNRACVAWFSVDFKDNDPGRFWRYIFAALQRIGLKLEDMPKDLEADEAPSYLIHSLESQALENPKILWRLVLDDFQWIGNQELLRQINELLDYLPSNLALIFCSQSHPALKLARRRSRGQLVELSQSQLAFTERETAEYLQHLAAQNRSDVYIKHIHTRSEGWPAGIQLLGLTTEEGRGPKLDSSHARAFFQEEVIAHLPPKLVEFITATAFLPWLQVDLCNAVCGQNDSQMMLELLSQRQLFIMKYGQNWRYHELFRETLLDRAEADQEARTRALQWFSQHGYESEAIEMALRSGQWSMAVRLMAREGRENILNGQYMTVSRWLRSLPESWQRSHPRLLLLQSMIQLVQGDLPGASRFLERGKQALQEEYLHLDFSASEEKMEAMLDAEIWQEISIEIKVTESFIAMFQGDFQRVQTISGVIQSDISSYTGIELYAQMPLCQAYIQQGELLSALKVLETLRDQAQCDGLVFPVMMSLINAIPIYQEMARLDRALEVLDEVEQWLFLQESNSPLQPWCSTLRMMILREQGKTDAAAALISESLLYLSSLDDPLQQIPLYVLVSMTARSYQNHGLSRSLLLTATNLEEKEYSSTWPFAFPRPSTLLLISSLEQSAEPELCKWLSQNEKEILQEAGYLNEANRLFLARVYLVLDRHEDLLKLCTLVHQSAACGGRILNQIRCSLLIAASFAKNSAPVEAGIYLKQALELAECHALRQIFVDEGPHLKEMLNFVKPYSPNPEFIESILQAYPEPVPSKAVFTLQIEEYDAGKARKSIRSQALAETGHASVEPLEALSRREQEVLHLISQGLKNGEIAKELFLSVTTVKTHAHNIYTKMKVRSRTAAVAKAREQGLLA